MKHITRWTPDTHPDVSIDYEWDDAVPADQRTHTFIRFARKGDKLERVGNEVVVAVEGTDKKEPTAVRFGGLTDVEKYQMVVSENQSKNNGLKEILGALPENHKVRTVDGEGNESVWFKNEPVWNIAEDGVVEFKLAGSVTKKMSQDMGVLLQSKLGNVVRVKE